MPFRDFAMVVDATGDELCSVVAGDAKFGIFRHSQLDLMPRPNRASFGPLGNLMSISNGNCRSACGAFADEVSAEDKL